MSDNLPLCLGILVSAYDLPTKSNSSTLTSTMQVAYILDSLLVHCRIDHIDLLNIQNWREKWMVTFNMARPGNLFQQITPFRYFAILI